MAAVVKHWFNDEDYKAELTAKAATNEWFIIASQGLEKSPAKVIMICYAGLKYQLPDGSTNFVRPTSAKDISSEEYEALCIVWIEKQRLLKVAKEEMETKKLADAAALDLLQTNCLHEHTVSSDVMRHPACDINVSCLTS